MYIVFIYYSGSPMIRIIVEASDYMDAVHRAAPSNDAIKIEVIAAEPDDNRVGRH